MLSAPAKWLIHTTFFFFLSYKIYLFFNNPLILTTAPSLFSLYSTTFFLIISCKTLYFISVTFISFNPDINFDVSSLSLSFLTNVKPVNLHFLRNSFDMVLPLPVVLVTSFKMKFSLEKSHLATSSGLK